MLQHQGVIRHIDPATGMATVSVPTDACGSCGHKSGCAMGRMSAQKSEALLRFPAASDWAEGNTLTLQLNERDALFGLLGAYLIPSMLLILGSGFGLYFFASDTGAAFGAIFGLCLGLLLPRFFSRLVPRPLVSLHPSLHPKQTT